MLHYTQFYNDAVAEARRQGVPVGVYTDRTMWSQIMTPRFSVSRLHSHVVSADQLTPFRPGICT